MILHPGRRDDASALRALVSAALVEHGLVPDPTGPDADLDDVEASYVAKGGMFEVLVDAEGVVRGSVGLAPLGDGVCELRKMYLDPAARGQGHGRRLLERAIAEAKRLGFRRIELETAAPLRSAMALYERYGFRRLERPPHVSRCDRAYALDLDA